MENVKSSDTKPREFPPRVWVDEFPFNRVATTAWHPQKYAPIQSPEYLSCQEHEHIVAALKTQIEILTAPEQVKYVVRQYAELDQEGKDKINALMKAMLAIRSSNGK